MIDFRNREFVGSGDRRSLFDCYIDEHSKAVIIFIHGFKGFKDWGAWGLMEKEFIAEGFGFVKFNMSHNGGTVEEPIDFPDLDAFGKNRYSYEVNDLSIMVGEVQRLLKSELKKEIPIYLLGHSRGGGIAILQGSGDPRIKKIISLAGISDISGRFPQGDELEQWENDNVIYVENARTNQAMPLYYSLYLDFVVHDIDLDIEIASRGLDIPFIQIHGDQDDSVEIEEGELIAEWTQTRLQVIQGADHTFGMSHPWKKADLPNHMKQVVKLCIDFFNT